MRSSVLASKPDTFESAKELAQSLIDYGGHQNSTTSAPAPQKGNNNNNNNYNNNNNNNGRKRAWIKGKGGSSQESAKKQLVSVNAAIVPATAPTNTYPTKSYIGNLPKCTKCNYHHHGPCRDMQCANCSRKGHTARFCKEPAKPITEVPGAGVGQACYGCGEVGHYKRNCPKAAGTGGVGRVLAIGHDEAVADPTIVAGTFLLDNSYACILFDSGAERSFVSQNFIHLLKPKPSKLEKSFTVEMANGKTENTNCIYMGCTLTLDGHSFPINLMPVQIKSFDVIVGMDWLSLLRADIMCFEKAVRLNLPNNETLVIYGDKSSANLRIISCIQARKCLRKDCRAFLAHIVDTSQELKDIKSISVVRDFPDIFP